MPSDSLPTWQLWLQTIRNERNFLLFAAQEHSLCSISSRQYVLVPSLTLWLKLTLIQRLKFPMGPESKCRHTSALFELSGATGLYPEYLSLKGIEMDAIPIAGGGFTYVYKGSLHGTEVALKVLRICPTSDSTNLLQVRLLVKCQFASFS